MYNIYIIIFLNRKKTKNKFIAILSEVQYMLKM